MQASNNNTTTSYVATSSRKVSVNGINFTYRTLGSSDGVPLILLNHLTGNLDNWDPRIVDGLAAEHRVITFNNRGVGSSEGKVAESIDAMALDAIAFIKALGFDKVDLLGFSLGGFISQVIVQREPQLVRKLILAGTGPAGGEGIKNVTKITILDILKGFATFKDPKTYLFFTRTQNGKHAASKFLGRLKERTDGRDTPVTLSVLNSQLKAIHAFGLEEPSDLSGITQPTLVANGDDDRMVPTSNSYDLAKRIKNSTLEIYPDAGHGGIFQYHEKFVKSVLEFLK